jgi:hypothetical protein
MLREIGKPLAFGARETAVPLNAHACVPYSTQGGPGETGNKSRCDPDEREARTRVAGATTGSLANAPTSTFASYKF